MLVTAFKGVTAERSVVWIVCLLYVCLCDMHKIRHDLCDIVTVQSTLTTATNKHDCPVNESLQSLRHQLFVYNVQTGIPQQITESY